MPCPWPWLVVQLAERFHVLPWHLEEEPTDRVHYYLGLLGVQGEHSADTYGLEPDEELYDVDGA